MNKLIVDRNRAKRIISICDCSHDNITCYSVRFKDVDGAIWVDDKMEIYNLLNKTNGELQAIANNQ